MTRIDNDYEQAITLAAGIVSEKFENPEYDRGVHEFIANYFSPSEYQDTEANIDQVKKDIYAHRTKSPMLDFFLETGQNYFERAYQQGGQGLVSRAGQRLGLKFSFCAPCDTLTPDWAGECAACGESRSEFSPAQAN